MKPPYIACVVPVLASAVGSLMLHPVLAAPGARQVGVSKQAALTSVARNVMLPRYAELAARCAQLATAADVLATAPTAVSLKDTQQAWVAVLLAWRRSQSFVHGPVADLDVVGRLQFWPLRPQSIDRVLRDSRPLDTEYVQELGANAVGLFPLESLLFSPSHDDAAVLATLTGAQGERRRTYVQAIARELASKTRLAEKTWQGPAGYASTFGAAGQDSLNLLLNDMLTTVELGAQERLRLVIDWQSVKILRAEMVEGGRSGSSQKALLSLVVGARETFNGGDGVGIDDYLRQLNAPAADRLEAQFQKTIVAVRAIGGPLDQSTDAAQQAVKQAHAECRALEILLKVEVASTLGVTLTFKALDGD